MGTHEFYLPSYEDCKEICNHNECFHEKIEIIDGFRVSIFDYRLAEFNDFSTPVLGTEIKAFELRGISFVHQEGKNPQRYLMLHKFFNLNQIDGYMVDQIKDRTILRVQDKADGSMIRFIRLPNGKVLAKTKRGFTNAQAIMAQQFYIQLPEYRKFIDSTLNQNMAAIFELTSPNNPVVITYSKTNLRLLQLRDEKTGKYLDIYSNPLVKTHPDIVLAEQFSQKDLSYYLDQRKTLTDVEGWVLTLDSGQMLKLKTEWYIRNHGTFTETLIRESDIIKLILEEKIDDILSLLKETDPRRKYVLEIRNWILFHLSSIKKECSLLVSEYKGNKKDWVLRNKGKPFFNYIASFVGCTNWEELVETDIRKSILKKCFRLMSARQYLQDNGFKLRSMEACLGDLE